jgi:GDP-fucose transporter C1
MVLPLTIFASAIDTRVIPSTRVLSAAGVVTLGFILGIAPHQNAPSRSTPSVLSLVYGLLSSVFIAVHAVLIKKSLPYCNNSTIQLAWWTNVGSAIFLLPFVVLHNEVSLVFSKINDVEWNGLVFVWGCLTTGFFGFLLCIAGLLSIKVTSPVTHMFSSVRRFSSTTLSRTNPLLH